MTSFTIFSDERLEGVADIINTINDSGNNVEVRGVRGLRRAGPGRLHCSPGERGNSPGEHVERSPRRPFRPTHPLHTSDTRWPNQDSRLQNPDQRVSAWSPSTWPVGSSDCGPVKDVRPN